MVVSKRQTESQMFSWIWGGGGRRVRWLADLTRARRRAKTIRSGWHAHAHHFFFSFGQRPTYVTRHVSQLQVEFKLAERQVAGAFNPPL